MDGCQAGFWGAYCAYCVGGGGWDVVVLMSRVILVTRVGRGFVDGERLLCEGWSTRVYEVMFVVFTGYVLFDMCRYCGNDGRQLIMIAWVS